jgi:regulator of protease activity HflC (stomatin/prohibitin superfamily)
MVKRLGKVQSYKVKQAIFAFIVLLVVVVAYLILSNSALIATGIFIIGFLAVFFFVVATYDFLITLKEYERAVIFRAGRVSRVGGPGWAFILPALESFKLVDLRTQTIDVKPQSVITKDNVVVTIDAVIYLYIKKDAQSVINSVVEIDDYRNASAQFVQSKIRDVAGNLSLQELISDVGKLNSVIKKELESISREWGVAVDSVEIQNLQVPKEVEAAFTARTAAEQNKQARIQTALGVQGEIDAIREAAAKLDDKSLSYFYMRTLEKLGEGQSSKFILPLELTNLIHSLAKSTKRAHSDEGLESIMEKYAPLLEAYLDAKKKDGKKK